MGYTELKNQMMEYVFSDDDPKKIAERYIELNKYTSVRQITPAAEYALHAVTTEMTKCDTPEHRKRLFTLIETVNEKRENCFETAVRRYGEDPGIITEPFYSAESESLNLICEAIIFPLNGAESNTGRPEDESDLTKKRWDKMCEENGIPVGTSYNEFAVRSHKQRQTAFMAEHPELKDAHDAVDKLGLPLLEPERLDRHPVTDKDGNKLDFASYRERRNEKLKDAFDPKVVSFLKGETVSSGSFPWITSAYMDIGQADISKLSQGQQNSYLFLLDKLYNMNRHVRGMGDGTQDLYGVKAKDYLPGIYDQARDFCRDTRNSGSELNGVKAAVYGMVLAFEGMASEKVRGLEQYLSPEVINAGKQKAAAYAGTVRKKEISFKELEQDKPVRATPMPNLWTEEPIDTFVLGSRLEDCTPEERTEKARLRKDFYVMAGKAAQLGQVPGNIREVKKALEKETSGKLVSDEAIRSCLDEHKQSITKTWDKTFLSDKLSYRKLGQLRDLNDMLIKTDPALHINSPQFKALKTAMAGLVSMTNARNLDLNNPGHKKQLSAQIQAVREACGAWLDKENTKTSRKNNQRYGLVLGILGNIDPVEAEKKLSENRSPLKYNGIRIDPNSFDTTPLRADGKTQTSAEMLSLMVTRLAGTKYSGWTEKRRQEYYQALREKDLKTELRAQKGPGQQHGIKDHSMDEPAHKKKHNK